MLVFAKKPRCVRMLANARKDHLIPLVIMAGVERNKVESEFF